MDKEPIRVAQIMGKMVGGGVESVVMNYYRCIDKTKVQFDFIIDSDSTNVPRKEIEMLGGRVIEVPPYQQINRYIPELIRLFKQNGYKIVHSHINTLSVFPLYAAKKAGVPVRVAHNHSTAGKGETKKNILKYILRPFAKVNATHYAACTRHAGVWLFGKKSAEKNEITVFNNAIDLDKFTYNEQIRNEERSKLGVENKFVIGHVGRFCYAKNQDFLVDIFSEIHKKNPDSVLMMLGDGADKTVIEQKVHDMGLDDCVLFLGNVNDINRKYQAMDVLVFPSRYEGLGMVAVEAQVAGVPSVVSTELPGDVDMTECIEFVSLTENSEIWSEKVMKYVSYERKDMTQIIKENGYDITAEADKLCEYYELVSAKISGK